MGVNFSTKDLNATLQVDGYSPVWTFETDADQRIRFRFPRDFRAYSTIEIGDGTIQGMSTRLAQFTPVFGKPSDVTSISHLAWLSFNINHRGAIFRPQTVGTIILLLPIITYFV